MNTLRAKYTEQIINFYGDLYTKEFLDGLTEKNFNLIYEKYEDAKAQALWETL